MDKISYLQQNETLPNSSNWDNMCGAYCLSYYLIKSKKLSYLGDKTEGEIILGTNKTNARNFVSETYNGNNNFKGVRLGENNKKVISDYSCPIKIKNYLANFYGITNAMLYYDKEKGSRTTLENEDMQNLFSDVITDISVLPNENWYIIALLNHNVKDENNANNKSNYEACHYVLLVKDGDNLTIIDPLVAHEQNVPNFKQFLSGKDDNARFTSGSINYKFLRAGVYIPF